MIVSIQNVTFTYLGIHEGGYAVHVHPELHHRIETAQENRRAIKDAKYGIRSSKYD
jgi:hypothetical protein